jgi:CheY-like chemotaxis protein
MAGWPAGALAGVRVLLVEDDADARDLVCRVLERQGATVVPAASADEGLAAMERPPAADAADAPAADNPPVGDPAADSRTAQSAEPPAAVAGRLAAFDVLLSDIGMPDRDGYDLIGRIRAMAPDRGGAVPAAALTAFARPEDRSRALAAGYQAHVAKPVDPAELVRAVAELAGRSGPS